MVPGTTRAEIVTSEVPRARLSGMPMNVVKAGTMMMPPPIPSRPETKPATRPMAAYFQPGVIPSFHGTLGRRPRISSTPVQPMRTEVMTRSRWAFTTSVRTAPAMAPAIPGPTAHRKARELISPARPYVIAPTTEVGNITGSGVATAWMAVPPSRTSMAGVVTVPPPTPNRPDPMPATKPTRTPTITWSGVMRGARLRAAAPRALPCTLHDEASPRGETIARPPSRGRAARRHPPSRASGRSGRPFGRARLPRRRSSGSLRGRPRPRPPGPSPPGPHGPPLAPGFRPARPGPWASPTPDRPVGSVGPPGRPRRHRPNAGRPRRPRRPRFEFSPPAAPRSQPILAPRGRSHHRIPASVPLRALVIRHRGCGHVPRELGRGGDHRSRRDSRDHRRILCAPRRALASVGRRRRVRRRHPGGQRRLPDRPAVRSRFPGAPRAQAVDHARALGAGGPVLPEPRGQDGVPGPVHPVRAECGVHPGRGGAYAVAAVPPVRRRRLGGVGDRERRPRLPHRCLVRAVEGLSHTGRAWHPGAPTRFHPVDQVAGPAPGGRARGSRTRGGRAGNGARGGRGPQGGREARRRLIRDGHRRAAPIHRRDRG